VLHVLDFSYNPIGGPDSAVSLCNLLKQNENILHADFSNCNFKLEECKTIEEGLNVNKTMIGFHFEGNGSSFIDERGFMQFNEGNSSIVADYKR
jgi:hypothetical protein